MEVFQIVSRAHRNTKYTGNIRKKNTCKSPLSIATERDRINKNIQQLQTYRLDISIKTSLVRDSNSKVKYFHILV